MKKLFSLVLALVMAFMLCVPAFAATGDITLTYDLKSSGQNDIVVQTGDVITVAYSLSASEKTNVSVTQNEIYYDHNFFEIVVGSNKGSVGFEDYTTTIQTRLSGKRYVYFNTIVTHTHDTTPTEIGTFQLKVIATEGETTVSSVNNKAFDLNADQYGAVATDLHVSIGKQQTQKFTLIFNNEGGSVYKTMEVESGASINLPDGPSKDGYSFSHWSIGGDTNKYLPGQSYTATSDVSFTPNWTQNPVDPDPDPDPDPAPNPGTDSKPSIKPDNGVADPADTGVADWLQTEDHVRYMNGLSANTFGPDRNMTRAEAAQMFYNLLLDRNVAVTVQFKDVPSTAWYAKAVNTLASLGILKGMSADTFAPDRQITRAEFAAIAVRFAKLNTAGSSPFKDVSRSDWYYSAVMTAVNYKWIGGYSDGTFRPNNAITRAEVTTIVNRMLNRSADKSFIRMNLTKLNTFTDVPASHWAYYTVMEAANGHSYTVDNGTEVWESLK